MERINGPEVLELDLRSMRLLVTRHVSNVGRKGILHQVRKD